MTKSELIKELEKYPNDIEVKVELIKKEFLSLRK